MNNNWKKCPNCSPSHEGSNHEKDFDENGKPIWKCICCNHGRPRKIYKTKKQNERNERLKKNKKFLNEFFKTGKSDSSLLGI